MGTAYLMLGNSHQSSKIPYIKNIIVKSDPTPGSLVYYSSLDDNYLIIDASVEGITLGQFKSLLVVNCYNGAVKEIKIQQDYLDIDTNMIKTKILSDDDLIHTGDYLQITIANSTRSIQCTYMILLRGDILAPSHYCDGKVCISGSTQRCDAGLGTCTCDHDDCWFLWNIEQDNIYTIPFSTSMFFTATLEDMSALLNGVDIEYLRMKVTDLETYLTKLYSIPSTCEHEGGTATCTTLATCSKCGEPYGEFAEHVYPTVTSNDIQWTGSDGTPCTSAYLSVNCLTCGGATISEYGELIIKEYDSEGCGGTEDCYARFEHELFRGVNPARCKSWHTYLHTNYTAIGTVGGLDCLDEIMNKLCCECGEHIEYTGSGKYGPHNWDSWGAISGVNKHARSCLICEAYEEGSCVMLESSVSYSAAPTITNEHWVNGTCEECGRPMQYSEPCEFEDGNACWKCNCEPH